MIAVGVKARWILGGVLAVTLAGCGSPGSGARSHVDRIPLPQDTLVERMLEPGRYGGRFVVGVTAGPRTFNPHVANESNSREICDLLYASLADIDNITQADVPLLAKSWAWSDSGRTLTFHLRRGLRFSDGHPLTSADLEFSFDVVLDDTLPTIGKDGLTSTDPVTGRQVPYRHWAPDSLTFVVSAPAPNALLLSAASSVRVLPKHVLEPEWKAGRYVSAYGIATPPEKLVGSGAWRLAQFVPDQKVVLERNPYWFGVDARGRRLPYLDNVVFQIVPDQAAAALKFHAGELDGLDNVRPQDYRSYAEAGAREGFTLHEIGPSLNTNFLWFNLNLARADSAGLRRGEPMVGRVKYGWFADVNFRRAVSHAIDRRALIAGPFHGFAIPNWSLLTRGNRAWFDSTIAADDYDPAAARRLLAGLGWRDRNGDGVLEDAGGHTVTFTILTNVDNTVRRDMCTLICDDLARVGIRAVPAPLEMSTVIGHIRGDLRYEACLMGLGAATPPDPGMYPNVIKSSGLTHYWHILQDRPGTPAEARLDSLYEANVLRDDPVVRHRTWHEIAAVMQEQCWFVWLPTQIVKIPVRSRFGNVEPSAIPARILWNIDRVFEKPGAERH